MARWRWNCGHPARMDRWTGRETQSEAGAWRTRKKRRAMKGRKKNPRRCSRKQRIRRGEGSYFFPPPSDLHLTEGRLSWIGWCRVLRGPPHSGSTFGGPRRLGTTVQTKPATLPPTLETPTHIELNEAENRRPGPGRDVESRL